MIEIHEARTDSDPSESFKVAARLDLAPNGKVQFHDADPQMVRFLKLYAAWSAEVDRPVEWTEGALWLRALPRNLRGTYTWAVEV